MQFNLISWTDSALDFDCASYVWFLIIDLQMHSASASDHYTKFPTDVGLRLKHGNDAILFLWNDRLVLCLLGILIDVLITDTQNLLFTFWF